MKLKYLTALLLISFTAGILGAGSALATPIPPEDFVTFEKTDDLDTVCIGDEFTYNITYTF